MENSQLRISRFNLSILSISVGIQNNQAMQKAMIKPYLLVNHIKYWKTASFQTKIKINLSTI